MRARASVIRERSSWPALMNTFRRMLAAFTYGAVAAAAAAAAAARPSSSFRRF